MIALEKLRRSVEEALAYLKTLEDIREIEVFASCNGNLTTRLNYTSHIPCNGVEEPKSTESYGLGIRAVFNTDEGIKTGFGSEPSNLSLEGVRRALEKARRGAVRDPEFHSIPRLSKELKKTPRKYHDPHLMDLRDEDLVDAGWRVINKALETFSASEGLLLAAGDKSRLKSMGLILGGDVTFLQERIAIGSSNFPRVQTDESTLVMSFVTAMVESADAKGSGWSTGTHLQDFTGEAGREAALNAVKAMGGRRVKTGEYTVIFGRQPVADLLNNIILPSLTTSMFYNASSAFLGKFGKKVASEMLSIYDHGAAPGMAGSKGITCEGLPTGKTELIKNGVLVGLLSNYYETQRILSDPRGKEKLGVDPREYASALVPRNGFRFRLGGGRHFDTPPVIAATNAFVDGSDSTELKSLIGQVQNGIYIGRIWYTYPINGLRAGDFTCTVIGDSYIIKDGALSVPLKPNTIRINDNIHNILNNITGVTKDKRGTVVWAADEIIYAPEVAVSKVRVDEIAIPS
ncbi:MAG: TldD/PmbA family protein [Chloroflexi bacterium]|nr:TldD/PmbA family protein [Chloroflexota bacterium]